MNSCPIAISKDFIAKNLIKLSLQNTHKINLIWLELAGCSGNIISLLNADNPDINYFLTNMISLKYNNSLMAAEGEKAYRQFLETLDTEFILVIEGAVSTKAQGLYDVVAKYNGQYVTGMEAAKLAGERAKHILAVGTCAAYGGISAAAPNPSESVSVSAFLKRDIINVPGCPVHPDWIIGTIAHLLVFGVPELDQKNRPVIFYSINIHDACPRRSFFDQRVFAEKLGEPFCMFKLGCRGPVTNTDCPIRRWNDTDNWPIGDNTPCIGCAREGFPDLMEPFIRY
ncbi:MAG: Ni/Fe hydrogenase [Peptococcaceae bacterium BICA1-8]|nr:MAG: Ni/Fe hydrogenase [Peptococcaceae bacterium BICA1-8]